MWKDDGSKFLDAVSMTYKIGSNGLYQYPFTAPATPQRMVADVSSTTPTAYGVDEIYVAEWTKDIAELVSGEEPPRKASFRM